MSQRTRLSKKLGAMSGPSLSLRRLPDSGHRGAPYMAMETAILNVQQ
jgi:hypothetical protein